MKKFIFLVMMALLLSCEKESADAESLGENANIVGTWVENGYQDDVTLFERASELDQYKYGFIIKDDGTFIERKNAGWCGTPPISFDNFEGTWEALSDSLMEITVGYWGGMMTYQIRIVTLEDEQLMIRYFYAEDRLEARIDR